MQQNQNGDNSTRDETLQFPNTKVVSCFIAGRVLWFLFLLHIITQFGKLNTINQVVF